MKGTVKDVKREYLSNIIMLHQNNSSVLFKGVDAVLNASQRVCLEACFKTCNDFFLHFFIDKVLATRAFITALVCDPSCVTPCSAVFDKFEPVDLTFLKDVVDRMKPSGAPRDAVPHCFFKEVKPFLNEHNFMVVFQSGLKTQHH